MRKLLRSFVIAVCLFGPAAQAQTLEDDVRAALAAEDYARLETLLADAHAQAVAKSDFSSIRGLYGDLFETANRERLAKTETWAELYPASPYAATALAWSHHHRSFLLRGERFLSSTSPDAYAAYEAERNSARAMVSQALVEAGDFIPALDLMLVLLADTRADVSAVEPLVARALAVAPSRQTLLLAQVALAFNWGGSLVDNIELCASMADKVPGYDAELCLIEVAFTNDADGALRETAVAALDTRDEPFLDYARLDAYLNEWRGRPEAADEAQRIHRASLNSNIDVLRYRRNLDRIAQGFGLPFYEIEARDAMLDALRARLSDDPQNYRIAKALIEELLERRRYGDPTADLSEAIALWPGMLDLGAYEPDVWRIGSEIAAEDDSWLADGSGAAFRANRIYYSNHDAYELKGYLDAFFTSWLVATGEVQTSDNNLDLDALKDEVKCPMFRVGRLFDAVCAADPGAGGCNIGGWGSDFPGRVRRLMKSETACEWERTADIEELLFEPVPVEAFLTGPSMVSELENRR